MADVWLWYGFRPDKGAVLACAQFANRLPGYRHQETDRMSRRNKPTLTETLGLRWSTDKATTRVVIRLFAAILFFTTLTLLIFVLIRLTEALLGLGTYSGEETQSAAIRNIILSLGAIIGVPFLVWRSIVAQKQVDVAEQGHITDRINKAVEGLGAEKTVKRQRLRTSGKPAFVNIAGKPDLSQPIMEEVTQPNLEVRIGAIYALERIAQDSDRDHVQIMEILCAYIRENAPANSAKDWPEIEMHDGEVDGPLEEDWWKRVNDFQEASHALKESTTCRTDIQTALTVIGRRSAEQRLLEAQTTPSDRSARFVFDDPGPAQNTNIPEDCHDQLALNEFKTGLENWQKTLFAYPGYRLDLRNTNLQGADLSGLNLAGARLQGSKLQCAHLNEVRLQGANLSKALLQGANLAGARLKGANLRAAWLQGADLIEAQMQGANLSELSWEGVGARLQSANLFNARLQGANLVGARLQGANLVAAHLQLANLQAVELQGAVLTSARLQGAILLDTQLQRARLGGAFLQGSALTLAELQEADLSGVEFGENTNLTEGNLQNAAVRFVDLTRIAGVEKHLSDLFGDASVILPQGCGPDHKDWPAHWPKFHLESEFEEEWHKWQADPENYVPPEPPDAPEEPHPTPRPDSGA